MVIDEIGKMELFSKPFISQVRRLFDEHQQSILATIPIARGGKSLQLVDEITKRSDVTIITVSKPRFENDSKLIEINTIELHQCFISPCQFAQKWFFND